MAAKKSREKRPFGDERPKSREETPKWATVGFKEGLHRAFRAMSLFAADGNADHPRADHLAVKMWPKRHHGESRQHGPQPLYA